MTLRVGVIGYGYWGPNLARNFNQLGNEARVTWVCDTSKQRLNRARTQLQDARFTDRFEDVLDARDVDAVVIATPVATHFPLSLAALGAGKHVLVSKPMTRTVAEAHQLCEEAARQKKTLFVDHTLVFHGAVKKAKELIDRGELGDLWYFDSVRMNLGLFQGDVNVLWDLAPHDLAVLDHWAPAVPHSVSAVGAAHGGQPHADVAYLTVHYASSFIAHVHSNWLSPTKVRRILVGGSKKALIYDDMEPSEKVKVFDRGIDVRSEPRTDEDLYEAMVQYRMGDVWSPRLELPEALATETRHFVRCCGGHEHPIAGGVEGTRVVKILEAASRSIAQGGAPVRCDEL